MLTREQSLDVICRELRNWFDRKRYFGNFSIVNDRLSGFEGDLLPGQYYRVIGSAFHDGVHRFSQPAEETPPGVHEKPDETFNGAVWAMVVPDEVLRLADTVSAWREQYETADSAAMSPFLSEHGYNYSYTKGGGTATGGAGWQSVFREMLRPWRKL